MLKKVKYLQEGELFIWADEYTRKIMLVAAKLQCRSGILECIGNDGRDCFSFKDPAYGEVYNYCYNDDCMVYVVGESADRFRDLDNSLLCKRCGERFGWHSGLVCTKLSADVLRIFVPNQERAEPDWFESVLGL